MRALSIPASLTRDTGTAGFGGLAVLGVIALAGYFGYSWSTAGRDNNNSIALAQGQTAAASVTALADNVMKGVTTTLAKSYSDDEIAFNGAPTATSWKHTATALKSDGTR